jgi:hypothetical protein
LQAKGEIGVPDGRIRGGLEIEDCARILAESKTGLPALAARRDECRVGPDERRSFEEVIRVWTLEVLSGIEG